MTETRFNTFPSNYLRPSYPIDLGRARTSMLSATALRATQPAFADGFVWLMKVLTNHTTRRVEKHNKGVTAPAAEASLQRRKARLLRQVSAELEAQA